MTFRSRVISLSSALLAVALTGNLVAQPKSPKAPGNADTQLKCVKDQCTAIALTHSGRRVTVYEGLALAAGWHRHSSGLAEFRRSCGSPCSVSIFVNLVNGEKSSDLADVVAVDPERALAATAGGKIIKVQRIFGGNGAAGFEQSVERDFSPVAALVSAIVSARFTPGGKLELVYLKGNDFKESKDLVTLDPRLLEK